MDPHLIQAIALGAAGGNIIALAVMGDLPRVMLIAGIGLVIAGMFA